MSRKIEQVQYGEARKATGKTGLETEGVYCCIVLGAQEKDFRVMAHFPTSSSFRQGLNGRTQTRRGLLDDFFEQTGDPGNIERITIIGGVEGVSEPLIKEIKRELGNRGFTRIDQKGPHNDTEEWTVRLTRKQRRITIAPYYPIKNSDRSY